MVTHDKVYIELDASERSELDYTEIWKMIESWSIPIEPISYTWRIEKKDPNCKRMNKFFKKLFNEANKNEN